MSLLDAHVPQLVSSRVRAYQAMAGTEGMVAWRSLTPA
jgi:hypothetical protein